MSLFMALFGLGARSDLSLLRAAKRTSRAIKNPATLAKAQAKTVKKQ